MRKKFHLSKNKKNSNAIDKLLTLFSRALLLCSLLASSESFALDYLQLYEQGKFLLQKGYYAQAIRTLRKASFTPKGRTHFGIHYYLALANYFLPSIQDAVKYIELAEKYAKTRGQRRAVKKLKNKIRNFYGQFAIVPQIDPEEVGRVKVEIEPTTPFSNKHKQRYFSFLRKKILAKGLVPNSRPIYIPKGEYKIKISMPQCLQFALTDGEQVVRTISIGEELLNLYLDKKPSCHCIGGQKLYRKGEQLFCACPPGLGWNEKKQRCETGVNPVPWILAGIGTVVVGTTAVIIGIAVSNAGKFGKAVLKNPKKDKNSLPTIW